jgi:hypothetical protein
MKTHSLIPTPAALLSLALASSLVVALGGCATQPVPNERMAVAEAAVKGASTTSTSENAPSELLIAKTKLDSARQAANNKDYERAAQLAEEAQVDARVAELHAQSEISRKAALESQEAARVLREEISRKTIR